MDNLEAFQNQWKESKQNKAIKVGNSGTLMAKAKDQGDKIKKGHLITISVLSITLFGLILFFIYVAPFQELLSHIGMALMCGGLLLRIAIELISYGKTAMIEMSSSAVDTNERAILFYQYRTKIHGALTYLIVAAYIIGFYLLTPEFSEYIALEWLLVMDIGFVFIAFTLIYFIRKTVVEELKILHELARLKDDLKSD